MTHTAANRNIAASPRRGRACQLTRSAPYSLAEGDRGPSVRRAMRASAEAPGLLGDGTPMTAWLALVEFYADRLDPTTGTPAVPQPHTGAGYGYGSASSESRPVW